MNWTEVERGDVKISKLTSSLYLLCHVDAGERCHVTVFVFSEHFAHGAGRRLTGQAVDINLLLFMLFTHQLLLLLLLLWLYVHKAGRDKTYKWIIKGSRTNIFVLQMALNL